MTNGPLTALAGGGVYAYGSANTFPSNTYQRVQLLGRRRVLHPLTGPAGERSRGMPALRKLHCERPSGELIWPNRAFDVS